MARKRMVTRTIIGYEIEVMTVDTETATLGNVSLTLTGDVKGADDALKKAQKLYETDTFKLIKVNAYNETEKMYGMLEVDFLKLAKELDPSTRKFIDDNTDDDDDDTEILTDDDIDKVIEEVKKK